MATPSSTSGPEREDAGRPASERRFIEEDFVPPPRRRASPLKLLALAIASFVVAALLFRAAVEAVRLFIGL